MMNINNKIKNIFRCAIIFTAFFCSNVFAAKYTITNGLDFNARIKLYINENYTSATPEKTITSFKAAYLIPEGVQPIDISEDNDSTVLAYIDKGIIYYVSEEEVFLNADASYMFDKFVNLRNVDLSGLDFSKTRKMNYMFGNCRLINDINMDNDTIIKLNEMEGMFFDCQSIVDLNIFMLNTKNVKNMNNLFYNCKNLKNIYISQDNWSTSNLKNFKNMFKDCLLLKTNFGRKATNIKEELYKTYAKYGEDEGREGLLKDYDYYYDDYGEKDGSNKVDNLNAALLIADGDINIDAKIDKKSIEKAKTASKLNIASDSIFYEQFLETTKLTDVGETLDGTPLLADETTYIDADIFKEKKDAILKRNSINNLDESIESIGGVLRHNYPIINEETVDESIDTSTLNTKDIEDIEFETEKKFDFSSIIVLISIFLIVFLSVFITLSRFKRDNDDLKDGSI